MKYTIITFLLIVSILSFSQNDNDSFAQNVEVNWQIGDQKTIYRVDSSTIMSNDSLLMETVVKSNYQMKVVAKIDTVYEVLFQQMNIDDNTSVSSEMIDATPIQKMMQELLLDLQKKMANFEYSFLVDRNTGQAFKVKNEKDMRKFIEELVIITLNKYLDVNKVELTKEKKKDLQIRVKKYMDEQMPAAMQTTLNAFNYFFQAYSFPFVLNKTHIEETMVYSVDEVTNGKTETPVKFIINSSLNDEILNIDYEYLYDKELAYNQYIVAQGKSDRISIDEFEISENVNTNFDMNTSWIINSVSSVKAVMGEIIVYQKTIMTLE